MAAVLRTGGEDFRQDLGRVAVGETFHHPHVRLVQAVPARAWVAGPVSRPIVECGQHVPPQRVAPEIGLIHGVDHLRRKQQRHRGPLALISVDARQQIIRQQRPESGFKLAQILDGVSSLPQGAFPIGGADVSITSKPSPIGLCEFALERILERLCGRATERLECAGGKHQMEEACNSQSLPNERDYFTALSAFGHNVPAASRMSHAQHLEARTDAMSVSDTAARRSAQANASERARRKKPRLGKTKRGQKRSGSVLLSRAVSRAVPSALEGLTSVFGMGTGGTPPI